MGRRSPCACEFLACVLARNRLTRTAAERGFVLCGECGQESFQAQRGSNDTCLRKMQKFETFHDG
jgi:hypothetical protein